MIRLASCLFAAPGCQLARRFFNYLVLSEPGTFMGFFPSFFSRPFIRKNNRSCAPLRPVSKATWSPATIKLGAAAGGWAVGWVGEGVRRHHSQLQFASAGRNSGITQEFGNIWWGRVLDFHDVRLRVFVSLRRHDALHALVGNHDLLCIY